MRDLNNKRYCAGGILLVKHPYVKLETHKDGFTITKADPDDPGLILRSDCTKRIIVSKALQSAYAIPEEILIEHIKNGLYYKLPQVRSFPELPEAKETLPDVSDWKDQEMITMRYKDLYLPFLEEKTYTADFIVGKQLMVLIQTEKTGTSLEVFRSVYGQDLQMFAKKRIQFQYEDSRLPVPKFFRIAAKWRKGAKIRVLQKGNDYLLTIPQDLCAMDGSVIDGHIDAGENLLVCGQCHKAMEEVRPMFQQIHAIATLDPVNEQIRKMQEEAERIRKMITL